MSANEATYAAMRELIRVSVELESQKTVQPLLAEIRSLRAELETRSSQPAKAEKGDPGPKGDKGADSTVPGPKGDPGVNGKDGIATREELEMIVEQRMADIQVRTFADMYQGVWSPEHEPYTRSQAVTWGGQLYLALKDTKGKPVIEIRV